MNNSDTILIERVKKKDSVAFSALYGRYNTELLKKMHCRINNLPHAEDLLQALWLRVWEEPQFLKTDSTGSAAAYLHSYAQYQVLNYFRKSSNEMQDIDEQILEISDTEYLEIINTKSVQQLFEMIEEVVAGLPFTDRKIYDLRINQNLSVTETAKILNLKDKTVRNRMSSVLGTVRTELDAKYQLSKNTVAIIGCLELIARDM